MKNRKLDRSKYIASKLDAQLDEQVRQFLDNADKGLRIGKDSIEISRIFDWFAKDFKASGGIEAFIRRYRPDLPFKKAINYDWDVNGIDPR